MKNYFNQKMQQLKQIFLSFFYNVLAYIKEKLEKHKDEIENFLEPIFIICLLLVWVAFTPWVILKTLYCAFANPHRAWRVLVGLDVAANAVLNDDTIQTISKRAALARNSGKRWGCVLCKLLDKADKNHCDKQLKDD